MPEDQRNVFRLKSTCWQASVDYLAVVDYLNESKFMSMVLRNQMKLPIQQIYSFYEMAKLFKSISDYPLTAF
jgi:hypothetical protein